ncbi:MAG: radical SAM protein [Lachnospiraceae bacterium]|nr:radical SAM protein [Lachnospiraceae bacterium]
MENPSILTLLLTYACNLTCPFCGQNDIRKNKHLYEKQFQLSLDQVNLILDDAQRSGIRNVNLWGGEPLLHPDIFEIIKSIKKRRMRCFMVTNGTLLYKYAQDIVDSKLDFLQVSIDALKVEHDLLRKHPDLFQKIADGVQRINSIKRIFPFISSATVIMPYNIGKLDELADEVFTIGIGTMFFQLLMSYPDKTIVKYKKMLHDDYGFALEKINAIDSFRGDLMTLQDFTLGEEKINQISNKYKEKVTYPNIMNRDGYRYYLQDEGLIPYDKTDGCWSIKYKINVQPNGDVVLCPDFPDFVIGNVFTQSIAEIWRSEKRRKYIENFNHGKPLPVCFQCCQLWDKEEYGSWQGTK